MAANPDPARTSAASWWLVEQLLALEPGTLWSGSYVFKPGYHSTGDDNARNWPGDYSIQAAEDRRGASWRTRAAALDWTFPEAQNGDYRRIARYGARLRAGFDSRDPRLAGWREALGQADLDGPPEGLDFRGHFTRVPDDTHRWHWHFSEDREQVDSYINKRALLSVLRGQTLAQWQAELSGGGDDVSLKDIIPASGNRAADVCLSDIWNAIANGRSGYVPTQKQAMNQQLDRIEAARALDESRHRTTIAAIEALTELIRLGGGNADTAAILTRIDERAVESLGAVAVLQAEVLALAQALAAAEAERDELRARLAAAYAGGSDPIA